MCNEFVLLKAVSNKFISVFFTSMWLMAVACEKTPSFVCWRMNALVSHENVHSGHEINITIQFNILITFRPITVQL